MASLKRSRDPRLKAFDGGTAPENLTGEIARFLGNKEGVSTRVILVDAAELKSEPGTTRTLPLESLADFSFGTHRLPLRILANYLIQSSGCGVTVIGIQPANMDYREGLTPKVKTAVGRLAKKIRDGSWKAIPVA